MLKSELLHLLQQEIRRHDFSTFIDEPPSIAQGGRGVCVPGCPACKVRINTMPQFLDHLANEKRRIGGYNNTLKHRKQKTGIFDPTTRAKATSLGGLVAKREGFGIFAPGMQSEGALHANHRRWHLKRGVVKPDCALCSEAA
jgi:hypothetical protein